MLGPLLGCSVKFMDIVETLLTNMFALSLASKRAAIISLPCLWPLNKVFDSTVVTPFTTLPSEYDFMYFANYCTALNDTLVAVFNCFRGFMENVGSPNLF